MKHFKLIGPETTREFDIEDDEMIISKIVKISEYELSLEHTDIELHELEEQNQKIYPTENQ